MKTCLLLPCAALILAGCQSEPSSSPETSTVEATPAAFNEEGAPTVQFSVPDMMCEYSCVDAVKKTLETQEGVKEVQVTYEDKLATVAVDEAVFDSDSAIEALVDKQFLEARVIDQPNRESTIATKVSNTKTVAAEKEDSK